MINPNIGQPPLSKYLKTRQGAEQAKIDFELRTSSLAKLVVDKRISLKQARDFACQDIVSKLTTIPDWLEGTHDMPQDFSFKFIARVDTTGGQDYDYRAYTREFERRSFVGFSLITDKNVSHYRTKYPFMLAYDIMPEHIAHIFPYDSNTRLSVDEEGDLTDLPSTWLSCADLEKVTNAIGSYNQITCRTKSRGNIIKPAAVIAFNFACADAEDVAARYNIPIIIVHPREDTIAYVGDVYERLHGFVEASKELKNLCNGNEQDIAYITKLFDEIIAQYDGAYNVNGGWEDIL